MHIIFLVEIWEWRNVLWNFTLFWFFNYGNLAISSSFFCFFLYDSCIISMQKKWGKKYGNIFFAVNWKKANMHGCCNFALIDWLIWFIYVFLLICGECIFVVICVLHDIYDLISLLVDLKHHQVRRIRKNGGHAQSLPSVAGERKSQHHPWMMMMPVLSRKVYNSRGSFYTTLNSPFRVILLKSNLSKHFFGLFIFQIILMRMNSIKNKKYDTFRSRRQISMERGEGGYMLPYPWI